MESFDLDRILIAIGGWGKCQRLYYFSLCLVIIFSVFPMSYIFTARDIKYRCYIESCNQDFGQYYPKWLPEAVPFKEGVPSRCLYYHPESNNTCGFNHSRVSKCEKFVYERNQTTIVQDFGIFCDENLWKLTIVGTINVLGELVCLPFAGFVSDRFGRKSMILVSVALSTIIGIARSFSFSYYSYLALEFLDTGLGSGMYSGAFILALEIVDHNSRNMGNAVMCCAFALGQILLGAAAWISPSWRLMLQVIYAPGVFVVISLLFIPESVRWLISKNRTEEAKKILKTMAKMNGTQLEEGVYTSLKEDEELEEKDTLITVLKTKTLLIRTIHCSFTWICCNFPYYGLTIQSVALSEDIYINFMLTCLVEVPAYVVTYNCIERFGRRKSLSASLILAGISCIAVHFAGGWLSLVVFLSGKFFVTIAYTTLYIYTAEMFPTTSRHSTFAICSMFGRFGSMLAPQVPLLSRIFNSLPLLIFSAMAFSSGILACWFPETHNTKLPDKIDGAVHIQQ